MFLLAWNVNGMAPVLLVGGITCVGGAIGVEHPHHMAAGAGVRVSIKGRQACASKRRARD